LPNLLKKKVLEHYVIFDRSGHLKNHIIIDSPYISLMKKLFFLCLLPAFFAFRTDNSIYKRSIEEEEPSPVALAYFEKAFSLIEKNAYFYKHLDFSAIKHQALEKMKTAQTYADTYDAIRFVIGQLNDRHSYFQPPSTDGQNAFNHAQVNNHKIPFEVSVLDGGYGLLRLKSYNSINPDNAHRIADSLYSCLAEFDRNKVKGIILDMRVMEGGTYVPFLTGLTPLINAEQLIGFIDRKGKRSRTIYYKGGIYARDGRKQSRMGYLSKWNPLEVAGRPLAVLTGQYTASAGEMIVISFLGLKNVKLFGHSTFGVPTAKLNVALTDSAMISLTCGVSYDRQKVKYSGPIQPDVICPEEEAETFAKRWIDTVSTF